MPATSTDARKRQGFRRLPSENAEEDAERKGLSGEERKRYIGGAIHRASQGNKSAGEASSVGKSKGGEASSEHKPAASSQSQGQSKTSTTRTAGAKYNPPKTQAPAVDFEHERNVPPARDENTQHRQWRAVKQQRPGDVLLMPVGDFYEAWGEDAGVFERVAGVKAHRFRNRPYDVAAMPQHASKQYIDKLTDAGYRVALVSQVKQGQGAGKPETAKPQAQPAAAGKTQTPQRKGEGEYGRVPDGYRTVGEHNGYQYLSHDGNIYRRNASNPMGFDWVSTEAAFNSYFRARYLGEGAERQQQSPAAEPQKQREPEKPQAARQPTRRERIEEGTRRRMAFQRPRSELTLSNEYQQAWQERYREHNEGRPPAFGERQPGYTQESKRLAAIHGQQSQAMRELARSERPEDEARYRASVTRDVAALDAEIDVLQQERDAPATRAEREAITAEMAGLVKRRREVYDKQYAAALKVVKAERPKPAPASKGARPVRQSKAHAAAPSMAISRAHQDKQVRAAFDKLMSLKDKARHARGDEYREVLAELKAAETRYYDLRRQQDEREAARAA